MSFSVAVLASGTGSNLQALLDTVHGRDGIEIVCVGSNRADAQALQRARDAGVETGVFAADNYDGREARDAAMVAWLEERGVELVVLAGFMEILSPAFIRPFQGRIVNVHPSLLPAFPGLRSIEQALDYGVRVTGVTVHFVEEGVDSGPIVLQEAFDLPYHRDIEAVETRVHQIEHELLPRAVRLIAAGDVHVDGRQVRIRDGAG
ncbi:MAG: phosphoribosylglycinamide formyltransferase 1 [Thermoleophilaceae bacterium]|nr:phosphoribosylglycinamide formyltransferase 1 [Thermoleophilaceae bacterium]